MTSAFFNNSNRVFCYARFAEPLKMHDFSFAEELYNVNNVGIVRKGEDIVVNGTGLLLCCDFVKTTK